MLSRDLSTTDHCRSVFVRAMRMVNMIFKSFTCRDHLFLKSMFITFVRPHFEYCTVAWSPYKWKDIDLIERVQHNFTSRIPGYNVISYADRLSQLDMHSLHYRRIVFDLLFLFKIMHNIVVSSLSSSFVFCDNNTRSRGRNLIQPPLCRKESTINSFVHRVIKYWNCLPCNVQVLLYYPCFKSALYSDDVQLTLSKFVRRDCVST